MSESRDERGSPGSGEGEVAAEVAEDEGTPEGVVGGEDVEGFAGGGEDGEGSGVEEAEEVEEDVVGEDVEVAEAAVSDVDGFGAGAGEEQVAQRLDYVGLGTGRGF